jgi:hypothetical protein
LSQVRALAGAQIKMKNYYKKTVDIKNWLVTQDDLSRIFEFIKTRFKTDKVSLMIETASGNSKIYEDLDEMFVALKKSLEDKVIIEKIEIYKDESNFNKPGHIRNLAVRIYFDDLFKQSFFFIWATDIDSSYADWVEGTYSEAKNLAKRFEIVDKELIDKIEKRFGKRIILDFDGTIRKDIQEEIIKDKELMPVLINTDNASSDIVSNVNNLVQGVRVENTKDGFFNKIFKHPIVSSVIASLIVIFFCYLLYKYVGINLNNPAENKITTSSSTQTVLQK